MSAKNTKRFAVVGMLAGAMILGGTQASAQTQSGTQGATQASPQGSATDLGQSGTTAPFPESTTRPSEQTPLPPDVIGQPGTGGSGATGTLPSQDDALDPSRANDGNTTLTPDSNRTGTGTGTSNGTLTPDTSRGTMTDPGTGGSGTLGQDDTLNGNRGLDTGGDVNGTGSSQTSPDSTRSDTSTSVPRD